MFIYLEIRLLSIGVPRPVTTR